MLRNCLIDLLRFTRGVMVLLCVARLVATWWLGPDHTAVWVSALDAGIELDVNGWGPSPDLRVVPWHQQPATGANDRPVPSVCPSSPWPSRRSCSASSRRSTIPIPVVGIPLTPEHSCLYADRCDSSALATTHIRDMMDDRGT